MWKVVVLQLAVVLVASGVALLAWELVVAGSVMAGGCLVVVNAVSMLRVLSRSGMEKAKIYRSAVVRYIIVLCVLVALVTMGLSVLAIVAGMVLAYAVGYIFSLSVALVDWRTAQGK